MISDPDMLALLADVKGKFGAVPDFWQLANTIEENPDDWGWQRSKCSVCGERAVRFDLANGYRCEDHLA